MGLIRKLAGMALGIVTFLAGCWSGGSGFYGQPAYGVSQPLPPHDPTIKFADFFYIPASPASPGDTILFIAELNKPTTEGWIDVTIGDKPKFVVELNDNGVGSDKVGWDGIYHGELDLSLNARSEQGLPTTAHLFWRDLSPELEIAGDDLTILENGE